jgi:hypothetical protein
MMESNDQPITPEWVETHVAPEIETGIERKDILLRQLAIASDC